MRIKAKVTRKGDASKELKKLVGALGGIRISVGVPEDAAPYPDGTPTAMVAAVHEFGSPSRNIPERSFMRSAIEENQDKYIDLAQAGLQRVIDGHMTLHQLGALIGQAAEDDVKSKITDLQDPPLKEATIKAKGSDNPLIDTGHLRQSIRYEVTDTQ